MSTATATAETAGAAAPNALLSVQDIHAYYGESYIVQGVSFEIQEGEILALLGRNGAGKTSTLRTVARMANPDLRQGHIWMDGEPLHQRKAWQAARGGMALVPEDRCIISGLTVEENLHLAQIEPPVGWPLERIYEHFPRLAERRHQDAITMSGGEQQMLAVARALAREVRLLLLDEPGNHLDMESCDSFTMALEEFEGAVILVTHNEMFLNTLANRLIVFHNDKIFVFEGTYSEFLEKVGWDDEAKAVKKNNNGKQGVGKKELRKARSLVISERSRELRPVQTEIEKSEGAIETRESMISSACSPVSG